jgi:hypothetical protein
MAGVWVVVLIYAVFFGWACGWLADRKGYENVSTWQLLGFFFGVFALLVIGFSPSRTGGSEQYVTCPDCQMRVPRSMAHEHRDKHRMSE